MFYHTYFFIRHIPILRIRRTPIAQPVFPPGERTGIRRWWSAGRRGRRRRTIPPVRPTQIVHTFWGDQATRRLRRREGARLQRFRTRFRAMVGVVRWLKKSGRGVVMVGGVSGGRWVWRVGGVVSHVVKWAKMRFLMYTREKTLVKV